MPSGAAGAAGGPFEDGGTFDMAGEIGPAGGRVMNRLGLDDRLRVGLSSTRLERWLGFYSPVFTARRHASLHFRAKVEAKPKRAVVSVGRRRRSMAGGRADASDQRHTRVCLQDLA